MTTNRDHLWQAYIDGEMTACECSEFEDTLCESERERMKGEVQFEAACRDKLCEPVCCPDAVWERIKGEIANDSSTDTTNVISFPRKQTAVWAILGAAAAALVLMLTLRSNITPGTLTEPTGYPTLATTASLDSVNQFLKDFDVPLALDPARIKDTHHPRELVGARQSTLNGVPVKEIYYNCCGEPVEMIVAKNGTAAAEAFAQAENAKHIQATRVVGDHTIALLSHHPATYLLDGWAMAN